MLVPFSLELDALVVGDTADAGVLAQHVSMIRLWHKCGIMILSSDIEASEYLRDVFQKMPQRFRTRWQTAIKACRMSHGSDAWHGIKMLQDLSELQPIKQSIKVFFVDLVTAQTILNMDPAAPTIQHDGIEVCRFDACSMSKVFEEAEDVAEKPIFMGDNLAEVWPRRFKSVAEVSKEVVIVDRYACKPGADIQGLRQLLMHIDRDCNATRVHIIAAFEPQKGPIFSGEDAFHQVYKIKQELARGGVKTCTLNCVNDSYFVRFSHQRFIRFDNIIYSIDVGVSLFAGEYGKVYRTCAFSIKHCVDDYRKIEKNLKDHKDKYSGDI